MDPNQTLDDALTALNLMTHGRAADSQDKRQNACQALRDLVEWLDDKRGMPPMVTITSRKPGVATWTTGGRS
jgi:hypothetical protein